MKQNKYKITALTAMFIIACMYHSCKKDTTQNKSNVTENSDAIIGMDNAFVNMVLYNDSLDNDHNNSHAKHNHDLKYHHHDSLYNHHHSNYHHGDTTHHENDHHKETHHDQHDSLNLIHHKNHY
jgi:ABC-type nickel/cobalt efflux system permease component RcnA